MLVPMEGNVGVRKKRWRYQLGSRTKCLLDSAGWYLSTQPSQRNVRYTFPFLHFETATGSRIGLFLRLPLQALSHYSSASSNHASRVQSRTAVHHPSPRPSNPKHRLRDRLRPHSRLSEYLAHPSFPGTGSASLSVWFRFKIPCT